VCPRCYFFAAAVSKVVSVSSYWPPALVYVVYSFVVVVLVGVVNDSPYIVRPIPLLISSSTYLTIVPSLLVL